MDFDFPEDSRPVSGGICLVKVDRRDKESGEWRPMACIRETKKENYGMTDILRVAQQEKQCEAGRIIKKRDKEPMAKI